MRTSKYSEQQIIGFLNQATAGMPIKALCRKEGFSDATFYKWRAKYGGLPVSEAARRRAVSVRQSHLESAPHVGKDRVHLFLGGHDVSVWAWHLESERLA